METGGERRNAVLLDDQELLAVCSDAVALEVNIIGDDHLELGGRSVHINSAVLALNGLIKCRSEGYVPANTLRDSVGYDASPSSLNDDIKSIKTALELITGRDDLVFTPGVSKGKRYLLAGTVDFIDRRHDAMNDPALRQLYFDLSGEVPTIDQYEGEWLAFHTNDARRRAFSAMLREVSDNPVVGWFSQRLTEDGWPHRLSSETLEGNFQLTEKALVAFLQPDYTKDRYRNTLVEGSLAFYEVFFSTLRRADTLSRQMNKFQQGRMTDDLFQESAEKLMEYVMTFRKSDLNKGTLETFFYSRMAKVASGTMLHRLEEEKWANTGVAERKRRLIRSINKASETLYQELGREPSGPEIADRIKASTEDVEEALYMMERTNVSVDTEYFKDEAGQRIGLEIAMARVSMQLAETEEMINFLDNRQQVDVIFDSDRLKQRDKIALSIFYGVFVPGLSGQSFEKLTHEYQIPFVYPDTQEGFDAIVSSVEYSYTNAGKLLGFNRGRFAELIDEALRVSRVVLRMELGRPT